MGATRQEIPTWTLGCVWDFPACPLDSLRFASGGMVERASFVVFHVFWDGQGSPPEPGQRRMLLPGEAPGPALSSPRCSFKPSPARRWLRPLLTPNMCWPHGAPSLGKQQPQGREVIACGSGTAVTSLECALRCLSFDWNSSVPVLRCFLGKNLFPITPYFQGEGQASDLFPPKPGSSPALPWVSPARGLGPGFVCPC